MKTSSDCSCAAVTEILWGEEKVWGRADIA